MTLPTRLALRGDLLDFTGAPDWGATDSPVVRFRPDHWLLVEDGRIAGAQAEAPDATWTRHDHRRDPRIGRPDRVKQHPEWSRWA